MFYCKDCGIEFETTKKLYERHGLSSPPYEPISVCPNCEGRNFYEHLTTHCRCCGVKLQLGDEGYCSEKCRVKGEKLRKIEINRRKLRLESPLSELVRLVDDFNNSNNTKYSYGQFVALVLPKINAEKKNCSKKRKSI